MKPASVRRTIEAQRVLNALTQPFLSIGIHSFSGMIFFSSILRNERYRYVSASIDWYTI